MNNYIELLDKELKKLAISQQPIELYEPIQYILSLSGKRLRSVLSLLTCHLFSEEYTQSLPVALSVEIFHNFTLMHDDIMDKAPLRRGKETVHKKWDTNTAILSGDVMLVKAYECLSKLSPEKQIKILPLFNKCALDVCEGQQYDISFEKKQQVSERDYLKMIKLKTAVLLGFSMEAGALVGGSKKETAQLLKNFAINIGMGFQLKDDILDIYADQEKFGKQSGGDIIANKKTFLLIKALENAQGETLNDLKKWLTSKDFDNKEKVMAVTKIYNQLNIRELTQEKINSYFEKAFKIIETLDILPNKKEMLYSFARPLINREK